MTRSELEELKTEETYASDTDLSEIRKKWRDSKGLDPLPGEQDGRPVRNHGLFSKAERALEITGWSPQARRDIEIFRLVDTEGLTPLLMVLNDGGDPGRPTGSSGGAAKEQA